MKIDPAILKTDKPQPIRLRADRCTCGCHGKDPWHAKTIVRKVRDVTLTDLEYEYSDDAKFAVVAFGTVSHPGGDVAVKATAIVRRGRFSSYVDWSKA